MRNPSPTTRQSVSRQRRGIFHRLPLLAIAGGSASGAAWAQNITIDTASLLINSTTTLNGSPFMAVRSDPAVVEFRFRDNLFIAPGSSIRVTGPYAAVLFSAGDITVGAGVSVDLSASGPNAFAGGGAGGSAGYLGYGGYGGGRGSGGYGGTGGGFFYQSGGSGGPGGGGGWGASGTSGLAGAAGQAGIHQPGASAGSGGEAGNGGSGGYGG